MERVRVRVRVRVRARISCFITPLPFLP